MGRFACGLGLWQRADIEPAKSFFIWQYSSHCQMSVSLRYFPSLTLGERTIVMSHWLLLGSLSCELLPWAYLSLCPFPGRNYGCGNHSLQGCLQSFLVDLNWGDLRSRLSGAKSSQQLGWRKARTGDKRKPLSEASCRSLGSQRQREKQTSVSLVPRNVPDGWLHMVTLSPWGQSLYYLWVPKPPLSSCN